MRAERAARLVTINELSSGSRKISLAPLPDVVTASHKGVEQFLPFQRPVENQFQLSISALLILGESARQCGR